MKRYLEDLIRRDMANKIIILSGPRQVGKTTLSKQLLPSFVYLNYDTAADLRMIQQQDWPRDVPLVIFDELHKLKNWKSKIKGIFDTDGIPPGLLVTGSARLETARKGGDSLAGRFFAYRCPTGILAGSCLQRAGYRWCWTLAAPGKNRALRWSAPIGFLPTCP